jgi:hypothetical protein
MSIITYARDWYGKYERPISSFSLFFGFIFDLLTISRLDATWTSVYILIHLVLIGFFIFVIHYKERAEKDELDPTKWHFWYVNALQFLFGGILSTFLISYFRSADIFVTWPFILLLAVAFISNEVLKHHYVRLSFQISLYFLSLYSFSIFIIPILLKQIGLKIFLLSGAVSLAFILVFIFALFGTIKDKLSESKKTLTYLIGGIFVVINILYLTNLIPPIPLSMKDGGVYHNIEKQADGNYLVEWENRGVRGYFEFYKTFHQIQGEPVFAYSAVFSPTNLNTTVIHEWQHYDEKSGKWIVQNTVDLQVRGGRGNGFRTYSVRDNMAEGKWMVNVLTTTGQLVGRLRFNVVNVNTLPQLDSQIKK